MQRIPPGIRDDSGMTRMTARKYHRMSRTGLRDAMPIFGVRENCSAVDKPAKPAFIEIVIPRQIVIAHLVEREDKDQLGRVRRWCRRPRLGSGLRQNRDCENQRESQRSALHHDSLRPSARRSSALPVTRNMVHSLIGTA